MDGQLVVACSEPYQDLRRSDTGRAASAPGRNSTPTSALKTGAVVACSNISFDLYPGEVLGIVGESGSGKSTLVQLLYFDQEATSGEANFQPVEGGIG